MARTYPPLHQLDKQFCFLSPSDEHNRLLLDLRESVVMVPFNLANGPPKEELAGQLMARYGGSPSNWRLQSTRLGYLVRYPDWLSSDQILLDSHLWERDHGLQVFPWDCLDRSESLPQRNRVSVQIRGFPADYWHPCYFRQATSSWGTMVGIAPDNLSGDNKNLLKLLIDVHDTKLVPFKLYVGHGNRWSECDVELDGRHHQDPYYPPPSPPGDQGPHGLGDDEDGLPTNVLPYIPPWN